MNHFLWHVRRVGNRYAHSGNYAIVLALYDDFFFRCPSNVVVDAKKKDRFEDFLAR
jgi:hypothetical protein